MPAIFSPPSLQYLSLASNPAFNYTSGSVLTVTAFVKLTDLLADYDILAKNQDSYGNGSYCLRYNKDTNSLDWIVTTYTGSYIASVLAPASITTASSGTFVCCQWTANSCSISVNNGAFTSNSTVAFVHPENKTFTGTAHDNVGSDQHQFTIGYDPGNSNATYMKGKIGYVGIWDRLLTTAEITALFGSGGGLNFAALTTQVAGLAGWYNLNADANDSTQFGNNLTNNGTATFAFTW